LDAIKKIIDHDGISGLYSGINGALIGVASTNFAYFYWYSVVRSLYTKYRQAHPNTAVELSLGAVAGAIAQIFTIPVAVITTRQQTQPRGHKKGLFATGKEVLESEDGWTGLWRGLKASLVLCVNPAITYGAYQRLKDIIFPEKTRLRPWEAFRKHEPRVLLFVHVTDQRARTVLGAISKSIATICTQPLIVAKVGLQSRPPPAREGKPFKTFPEVMEYIIEHEGPLALFKGIGPQIMKGLLVQGLLMMTKERVELLFILIFAYIRTMRAKRLKEAARKLKENATPLAEGLKSRAMPVAESVLEKAKASVPATLK
jgi:hypothetical protein